MFTFFIAISKGKKNSNCICSSKREVDRMRRLVTRSAEVGIIHVDFQKDEAPKANVCKRSQ